MNAEYVRTVLDLLQQFPCVLIHTNDCIGELEKIRADYKLDRSRGIWISLSLNRDYISVSDRADAKLVHTSNWVTPLHYTQAHKFVQLFAMKAFW